MDIDYARNIAALEQVQPEWLTRTDIVARLGAPWIPVDVYTGFARHLDPQSAPEVIYESATNGWRIETDNRWEGRNSHRTRTLLGTPDVNVWDLLTDCLAQKHTEVTRDNGDGRRVRDEAATLAARDRQRELQDQFEEWVWALPARADRLERIYNHRFNAHVVANFDGSHLTFPGLSATFTPHQYQRNLAWRAVAGGSNVLAAWRVGAGKTAAAAMLVQELRRVGGVSKAMIVVPNHLLDQWAREYQQTYPTAKVLMASREMTSAGERQRFAAICATGRWDAVVISESAFTRIPLRPETQAEHLREMLAELDDAATGVTDRWSVKRLAAARKRLSAKIDSLMDAASKDVGVTFEQLGIDFLVIDELHRFKNREIVSTLRSVSGNGSKRAEDLAAKLEWLTGEHPGRPVMAGLTATPVSNGVAEMHTVARFVAPEVLDEAGVTAFDAWAATFAQTVNLFELSPEGDGFRTVERFARFHNVPEMARMYRRFADVIDAGPPPVQVERCLWEAQPGESMRRVMDDIVARARKIRNRQVTREEDNMLAVTSAGRLAAVDPRLVGAAPDDDNKLAAVADKVAASYHETAGLMYGTDVPGGCQIVFCDLGTPARQGWNCYDELAVLLTARGVDRRHVAFVQDAATDAAKATLFAKVRAGHVRILVGSTETCGVGMNVQTRLTDLHHVNPPWKPAEIDQREGRAVRPGNLNDTVRIHTYVTVGSFDAYSWTILTRKAGFLAQMSAGESASRVLEVLDVDDRVLSYEEIKAIASGNPLVLRKAELDAEMYRLSRLRSQHRSAGERARWAASQETTKAERAEAFAAKAATLIEAIDPAAGLVDGESSEKQIGEMIAKTVGSGGWYQCHVRGLVLSLSGRDVELWCTKRGRWQSVTGRFDGHAGRAGSIAVRQAFDMVDGLPARLAAARDAAAEARRVAADLTAKAEMVWPFADDLARVEADLAAVNGDLLAAAV